MRDAHRAFITCNCCNRPADPGSLSAQLVGQAGIEGGEAFTYLSTAGPGNQAPAPAAASKSAAAVVDASSSSSGRPITGVIVTKEASDPAIELTMITNV